MPRLSLTQWSSKVETLSALMAKYPAVLETLRIIAAHSNGEPRSNAQSYIFLIHSPPGRPTFHCSPGWWTVHPKFYCSRQRTAAWERHMQMSTQQKSTLEPHEQMKFGKRYGKGLKASQKSSVFKSENRA